MVAGGGGATGAVGLTGSTGFSKPGRVGAGFRCGAGAGTAGVMLYGISLLAGALGSAQLPAMTARLAELNQAGLGGERAETLVNGKRIRLWAEEHGDRVELDTVVAAPPTAKILFSSKSTATTEGSCKTTPFFGTNTNEFLVPRSIPIFISNSETNRNILDYSRNRSKLVAHNQFPFTSIVFLFISAI